MIRLPDPPIGLDRGSPGQARVRTLGVIIGNPPAKASPQLGAGLEGMEIDALVLQGSPKAFDEDIVHPPAPAIHADLDAAGQEQVKCH